MIPVLGPAGVSALRFMRHAFPDQNLHIECKSQSFKSKPPAPYNIQRSGAAFRYRTVINKGLPLLPVVALILLGLPIIEIAAFVLVGSEIGVLWTLALVVLSAVGGSILLRVQGFGALTRIRREMEAGRSPGREVAHGAMIMLAGILLLIPGFVTDVLGLLLFIPPVRELAWRFIRRRIVVVEGVGAGFGPMRRDRGKTIDLDEEDFKRTSDPKSPWRIGSDS